MGINHDLLSSGAAAFTTLAQGSVVNTTAGGTGAPVFAANHTNHAIIAVGTFGNTGTIFAYGHTAANGGGTVVLGSIRFGSGNFSAAGFDVTSDTLLNLGTAYAYVSGQLRVDSGGTFSGALFVLSYNARTAGTTPLANGIGAVGSSYT